MLAFLKTITCWGKQCFLLIYGFFSNNTLYLASLSFRMFILTPFDTWEWFFQIRPQSGVAFWVLLLGKKQVTFFCSLLNMKNFATSLFLCLSRSSRPDVFCKEGVLRNFTKFTGKHLFQCPYFNKVAGLRPATLLK